jgi:D-alanine-D-alanine ligase
MQRTRTERAIASGLGGQAERGAADMHLLEAQIERLKPRIRIAVIFGGNKLMPGGVIYPSANTRSWKSYEPVAADIAASLRRIGFRHVQLMPDDMYLGERLRREGIHIAWLNTGGVQGYNPTAHASAMFEMFGVPYVGHDPLTATTLDNKHAFKREALCAGLPTAPFATWHMVRGVFQPEVNSRFQRAFGDYSGPFVVKPVSGRASLHVHVVENRAALPDAVEEVYRATDNLALIEKYLPGREFCIAVAGPISARQGRLVRGGDPFTFAAMERVLSHDEKIFTSMDMRPITKSRCRSLDRQRDSLQLDRMHQLACEVFREFNLGSLVRLDVRSDEHGNLCILEANPKPDLKKPTEGVTSLIAEGLSESGMDYDDLILSLFADRLDFLLTHRGENVQHVVDLLHVQPYAGSGRRLDINADAGAGIAAQTYHQVAAAAASAAENMTLVNDLVAAASATSVGTEIVAQINEIVTNQSLRALDAIPRPVSLNPSRATQTRARESR